MRDKTADLRMHTPGGFKKYTLFRRYCRMFLKVILKYRLTTFTRVNTLYRLPQLHLVTQQDDVSC